MNIIEAIHDHNLFRPFLADSRGNIESWDNWQVALKALHGLPIRNKEARELIRQCTGRRKLLKEGFRTALFLTGRRSGKSRIAAVAGAYEAVLAGHESKLAKGERGIVLLVSPTKPQSRIVRDYIRAIFRAPILQSEVASETKDGFELNNGTRIEILAGDWRTVRGYTLIAAVVDEVCFFGYDAESKVKSDSELIRAILPSLATTGGKLIAISSPYAMKGWAYSQYKRNFGNDSGSVLVWNCPSRTMNPTLSQAVVEEALAEDLASAKAEYLGEFRDDVATYLPREVIEAAVVNGRTELSPRRDLHYSAFVDMSSGRGDDAALAIAHRNDTNGKIVLDLVRRWRPPFNPDAIVEEICLQLYRFDIQEVQGDAYAVGFVFDSFERRGIHFDRQSTNPWEPLKSVGKNKSQLYLEFIPRLCSGEVELLDNELLINQLAGLERRTRSGGRDIVDHGPNQHDDVANAVAGAIDAAAERVITLGPLFGLGVSAGESAFERFRRRQAENCREEAFLAQLDDGQDEWRHLMRIVGRL